MTGVQCTSVETVFILNQKQQRKGKSPSWTARLVTGWPIQISTCALATESDGVRAQSLPADALLLCSQGGISFCMTPLPAEPLNSNWQRFCFVGYVLEEWRDYARLPHDLTIRKQHLPTRNDKISGRRMPTETTNLYTPTPVMSLRVRRKTTRCVTANFTVHMDENFPRNIDLCNMDTLDLKVWFDLNTELERWTLISVISSCLSVQREWSDSPVCSNTPWNEKQRAVIQCRINKKSCPKATFVFSGGCEPGLLHMCCGTTLPRQPRIDTADL